MGLAFAHYEVLNLNKEMAHPKRFELLTPRFVVWGRPAKTGLAFILFVIKSATGALLQTLHLWAPLQNVGRLVPPARRGCGGQIIDLHNELVEGEENMPIRAGTNYG